VSSFFTKGVGVYRRLNTQTLPQAAAGGCAGTGKTMICSALAKWRLEQNMS